MSLSFDLQKTQLDEAINDLGDDPTDGKFDFVSFCAVASKFLIEEDAEQMKEELKEAFGWEILQSADNALISYYIVPGGDDKLNSRRNRMWHAIGIEVGTYYSA